MEEKPTQWIVVTERFGYLILPIQEHRQLVVLLGFPESGKPFLKVGGFSTGRTKYVGEKLERLAFEVHPLSPGEFDALRDVVNKLLPEELRNLNVEV